MANEIKDIRTVLLALHLKQKRYIYEMITETRFSRNKTMMYDIRSILKYHKEKKTDELTQKNKVVKIEDDHVRGESSELLLYLVDELESFDLPWNSKWNRRGDG